MSNDIELNLNDNSDDHNPKPENPVKRAAASAWRARKIIPRKGRIIIGIFSIAFFIIFLLVAFQPEAKKRPAPETIVKVNTIEIVRSDYPVLVNTNGTIQANIRGNLVSQIRGEIVKASDKFKNGGAFEKGEILIEVDQRDYLAALSQAAAAVSQAQATYSREQANAKQALRDWERLGNTGDAPELVARKPQLAAARAQMDSAKANFETAQLNLERTSIKAPYTGRVIRRNAVLGQYVGIGTVLAEIFATDGVEVRLPLSQDEFAQLGLDALGGPENDQQFAVAISTNVGKNRYTWDALITRADSTFDLNTRQIDVIATVINPFDTAGNKPPLKIGQFVNANIQGQLIKDAIVVPNKALREGSYVFISEDERLVRRPVTVAWQDDQNALISAGLNDADLVVTTSLNSTLAGAKVKLSEPANSNTEETVPTEPESSMPDTTAAQVQPPASMEQATSPELEKTNLEAETELEQQLDEVIDDALQQEEPVSSDAVEAVEMNTGSAPATEEVQILNQPAEISNNGTDDSAKTSN